MKITAKEGAYSSVVGGGVLLLGAKGKMVGQVAFLCHDDTLRSKYLQTQLSKIIAAAINAVGIEVPAMTSPLSPEAVAQMVADRKNAMSIQDALETLSAMASVQDGYAKKATDRGLRIIHKANAKAQREVAATVTALAADSATLRAELAMLKFDNATMLAQIKGHNAAWDVLRASEAAALERIAELEAASCSYQAALLKQGIDGSKGPKE